MTMRSVDDSEGDDSADDGGEEGRLEERRPCALCGAQVPHRRVHPICAAGQPADADPGIWAAQPHAAPCGRPCFGGGARKETRPWEEMHGWNQRCLTCGWLRVVPGLAEMMRERALRAKALADAATPAWRAGVVEKHKLFCAYPDGLAGPVIGERVVLRMNEHFPADPDLAFIVHARVAVPALAADLVRALGEIALLTAERDAARASLGEARDRITALEMEAADQAIAREDVGCARQDRGTLINAAATAGAHLIEAMEAHRRCPTHLAAERERLLARIVNARATAEEAIQALAAWAGGVDVENGRICVILDMDGVAIDFHRGAIPIVQAVAGRSYRVEDLLTWEIFDHVGREHEDACYDLFRAAGFCEALQPLPGAIEGVARLSAVAEVHVVTSPIHGRHWYFERVEWVLQHLGIPANRIHFSRSKMRFEGDVFVDDRPEHVERWAARHPLGIGLLWAQPWNRLHVLSPTLRNVRRATSWDDVIGVVREIERRRGA